MKIKAVIILVAATAVVGIAALMVNRDPRPSSSSSTAVPASLFPDLSAKVNDVATIDIKKPGETFSIQRTATGWGLASKGGFPVQLEQVKSAVVGVANLKPIEAKTSNPTLYSKIGVQDPGDTAPSETPPSMNPEEAPPTQPTLVTLKDDKGATLASVIIGTQKWGNNGGSSIFVRKAGEQQSWLAEGRLEVPTDAMQWIERQVLNIPRDRIKNVVILHPADGVEVEAARDTSTASFTVPNIPPGRELTAPTAPEQLVTGVQYLNIDDVVPAEQIGFSEPAAIAIYRTFDGLIVTTRTVKKDNKDWISLSFTFEEPPAPPAAATPTPEPVTPELKPPAPIKPPDEVKKEVEELSTRLSKWAFAIPEYKAKNFTATIDTLLKPLPAHPPTQPTPDGPTPGG
jgi:hypothetical protein